MEHEPGQSVAKKRVHLGKARDGSRHDGESAKGPRERGINALWYDYNQ